MTISRSATKTIKDSLKGLDYQGIVLFGSRARGQASSTSDYDLLIVLRATISMQEKMRLSAALRRKLACKGIDADIIIKSEDEVAYYKELIGNVTGSALAEGVSL